MALNTIGWQPEGCDVVTLVRLPLLDLGAPAPAANGAPLKP
jgi:hypothetical protein